LLTSPLSDKKKFVGIGSKDKKLWPKQMWEKYKTHPVQRTIIGHALCLKKTTKHPTFLS
jgi:hypothetical protein